MPGARGVRCPACDAEGAEAPACGACGYRRQVAPALGARPHPRVGATIAGRYVVDAVVEIGPFAEELAVTDLPADAEAIVLR